MHMNNSRMSPSTNGTSRMRIHDPLSSVSSSRRIVTAIDGTISGTR
jgi:hypothetical protein